MKHTAKLALTILASLTITACSSSGGGNGGSNAPTTNTSTPVTQPATATNKPVSSTPTATNNSNAVESGAAYRVDGDDHFRSVTRLSLNDNAKNLEQIVVDGQTIRISQPNIYSGGWTRINDDYAVCCGKYSDVRFGYSEHPYIDDRGYVFYNGNVTKTMPTSGVASYKGDFVAIFSDDYYPTLDHRFHDDEIFGSATFNVDFAKKTLSGKLENAGISPINVNATISGNSFNGSASSNSFNTKANLEGKFYGENAKELGGAFFDNEKTWGGAFGAAK